MTSTTESEHQDESVYHDELAHDDRDGYEHYEQLPMLDELKQLYDNGRALIDSEWGWQKKRLIWVGHQAKLIALSAFLVVFFLCCALLAMIFGTVLALAPILGAWGAMLAVFGGCVLLALFFVIIGITRIRAVTRVFADKDDDLLLAEAEKQVD